MTVEMLAATTVRLLAEKVSYYHTQVFRHRRILTTRICLPISSPPLMIKIMMINFDDMRIILRE